uniref:NADH-ubiquinone oxidoreductase chain 3 n=1 Tax=Dianemobius fascipes TaxID=1581339 RepID=A0A6B9VWJ3_9ORTH|nr:NADH dehydrogenase subunit 3 [Dianemobius fascipes]QHQ73088.1 NADH dehydrogenase subunit 3 [Dianemobius fascipes]WBK17683.1 NADH dehydrogenase subunit 3 [Dianemobius fascipes nigrofasciatus]
MYSFISFSFTLVMLTTLLIILSMSISKKSIMDREKSSPFECGFNPKSNARLPFSLRFFMIAIIFLIFDIEITILLPMFISYNFMNPLFWFLSFSFFIFILLLGLYHEWNQGILDWSL